jgi:hypothetical protein
LVLYVCSCSTMESFPFFRLFIYSRTWFFQFSKLLLIH